MPTSARAAFIWAAVSTMISPMMAQASYLICESGLKHQNYELYHVQSGSKPALHPQQTVKDRIRVRRTTRDVQIDREKTVDPVTDLFVTAKNATGCSPGTGGNNEPGFG